MTPAIQLLVQLAENEVGTRETPGANNTGKRIYEYQGATWLAAGAWPWCAAFCCWLMREWLGDHTVRAALGLSTPLAADRWRCRDARAFGWEKWARDHKLQVLPEGTLARAGDFVVYDFSHIGLVVRDQLDPKDPILAVEGNTNTRGQRDSTSGDGVWAKIREPSLVRSLIRCLP